MQGAVNGKVPERYHRGSVGFFGERALAPGTGSVGQRCQRGCMFVANAGNGSVNERQYS